MYTSDLNDYLCWKVMITLVFKNQEGIDKKTGQVVFMSF